MQDITTQAPREHPVGVSIMAILEGMEGISLVFLGLNGLLMFANDAVYIPSVLSFMSTGPVNGQDQWSISPAAMLGIASFVFLIGCLLFLLALSLWALKRWAFRSTLVAQVFIVLICLAGFLVPKLTLAAVVVALVLPVTILISALADTNARAAFHRPGSVPAAQ